MKPEPEIALRNLVGKVPWGVTLGVGTMLTMEFGREDSVQSVVRAHGQWHLWLYMCSWRMESDTGEILIASEDERAQKNASLAEIRWAAVSDVKLRYPTLDLEIDFDNGHALKTFSVNASKDHELKQWVLFLPELICLSARGDRLTVEDSQGAGPR